MNNIKLSIFTGVQDTDIIDLGLYNPSLGGVFQVAFGFDLKAQLVAFPPSGAAMSATLAPIIDDLNNNTVKYTPFQVADLLAAKDYLNKLKIACDTYPACIVKIETL